MIEMGRGLLFSVQRFGDVSILKNEDTACKAGGIGVMGHHEDGGFERFIYLAELFQEGSC